LTDLLLPGKSGVELTKLVHDAAPATAIVLITGHATVKTAVSALKRGASDYIRKPVNPKKLRERVQTLLDGRPDYLPNKMLAIGRSGVVLFEGMMARSRVMHNVFEKIKLAAQSDATVLITGESGTGKELAARAVHRNSPRRGKAFVAINCAAIPEALLESDLFGHERGAFTGAASQKKGRLEVADEGVVFLDEIGELAPGLQVKLLRVLQEREFERVGGTHPIKVDIRLIAATNRDLNEAVRKGEFRQDLYYRLAVVELHMPPLRERKEDIALLTRHFVQKYAKRCNVKPRPVARETMAALVNYDWPGNVRELENAIERALVMGSSDVVLLEDLPDSVLDQRPADEANGGKYHASVKQLKKELIVDAVERTRGNYVEAAAILGVHPNYLHRLIRNLGLKDYLIETLREGSRSAQRGKLSGGVA
jgi:DNA-binding NtrC family response regulator